MSERLIHEYTRYSPEEEQLLIKATLIEDQLRTAGAISGKDYTILDCFKLAVEHDKVNAIRELVEELKHL